jgi:hypothetical protein
LLTRLSNLSGTHSRRDRVVPNCALVALWCPYIFNLGRRSKLELCLCAILFPDEWTDVELARRGRGNTGHSSGLVHSTSSGHRRIDLFRANTCRIFVCPRSLFRRHDRPVCVRLRRRNAGSRSSIVSEPVARSRDSADLYRDDSRHSGPTIARVSRADGDFGRGDLLRGHARPGRERDAAEQIFALLSCARIWPYLLQLFSDPLSGALGVSALDAGLTSFCRSRWIADMGVGRCGHAAVINWLLPVDRTTWHHARQNPYEKGVHELDSPCVAEAAYLPGVYLSKKLTRSSSDSLILKRAAASRPSAAGDRLARLLSPARSAFPRSPPPPPSPGCDLAPINRAETMMVPPSRPPWCPAEHVPRSPKSTREPARFGW